MIDRISPVKISVKLLGFSRMMREIRAALLLLNLFSGCHGRELNHSVLHYPHSAATVIFSQDSKTMRHRHRPPKPEHERFRNAHISSIQGDHPSSSSMRARDPDEMSDASAQQQRPPRRSRPVP
ncbi:hypothetical protein C8Q77DRAFT_21791 [Trametes polyzona]|nr:hypothetical protein C8Q77DRAFT_21791 [Trametes polyzona]